jgi:hypothetical protein
MAEDASRRAPVLQQYSAHREAMRLEGRMAETIRRLSDRIVDRGGIEYEACVCAAELPDGLWEGWIEFRPLPEGEPVRSPRETTQANRSDVVYWASGITRVYLEGALSRALRPVRIAPLAVPEGPLFSRPAPAPLRYPGERQAKS